MTLILGIDPGSRVTGYGLVAMEKNKSVHVASGCVDTVSYTHLTLPTICSV